ncbi:intermembrane phospholipid transport protein YdbH family protein [Tepidicaulis sp. LMO-SS28]|uniref:intermembrane phospholipid transport protein YdbH family protein n=1 Tax=Tepidicaulis sp. LMO-SS28 TaxID=3447455 RepID=UPI003EE265C7
MSADHSERTTERPKRHRRGWVWLLILLLVLAGLGGAAFWAWENRLALIEEYAKSYLASLDLAEFDFRLSEAGVAGVDIEALRIGPAVAPSLEAERIEIRLASLLQGLAGVSGIEVEAPVLRLGLSEEGALDWGALAPLLSGGGDDAGTGAPLFLPPLAVHGARIEVKAPQGLFALEAGARLVTGGSEVRLELEDCARAFLPAAALAGFSFEEGAAQLCALEDEPVFAMSETGAMRAAFRLPAQVFRLSEESGMAASGMLPAFSLRAESDAQAAAQAAQIEWQASGGEVTLTGPGLVISALEAEGSLHVPFAAGEPAIAEAVFSALRLTDAASPKRFADMGLAGRAALAENAVRFDGKVQSAAPLPRRHAEAVLVLSHNLTSGRGEAALDLDGMTFEEGALEAVALAPILKGMVTRVTGTLAGKAVFAWTPQGTGSRGTLSLSKAGFSTAAARIEGISGPLAFSSLLPPVTKGVQTLEVGRISAGLEFLNGSLSFETEASGAVHVHRASWPYAGGQVSLAETRIVPGAAEQLYKLEVTEVDLSAFLEELAIDGVSGEGTLNGRIPVLVRGGDVLVEDGRLEAAGPGVLAYKGSVSEAETGGQSDLVFKALSNFHYTSLAMTLEGNALDTLTLGLFIEGANPDLYDGYPFKINIRTEAAFADLIQRGTIGFRAMDVIREEGSNAP